ncbi:non-POU domain-containing octamer-binding protein-like isoform X1 [Lytechinus variegatus]|uniref:non-POU domain-containing octamer-binding protein-like isoform X1 n=1 Tax=Lytechinus variegatus TaxID=7654 RepID=UPI001BB0FAE4|nr:non-POU domain-containing octamer-binding protein-like isoform X1 [Lytechinus variegatus]XP_041462414.1 non-POU domain-containing octamer-binding protein-like isoform X1 [Lytechinus variegatus]
MPNREESRGTQGQKRPNQPMNNRGNDSKGGGEGSANSTPNKPNVKQQHNQPQSQDRHDRSGGQHHQHQSGGEKRHRPQFQGNRKDYQKGNDTLNPLPEFDAGPRTEKKFTGRCRLFVGNLANDVSESDFKKMFEKFGEVSETFLNSQKGFGFIRLDTRLNAEAAKAALDGTQQKNRTIRVRFATHGAALRVKNIPPSTSNELLEQAFSMFGEVERAIVIVDDRGRPTKNGIVEFSRKPGAQNALNRIGQGVFLLTAAPFPVTVEPLEQKDEEDGNQERYIMKNREYQREREQPPRFAQPGTFEYEWGQRMKALEEEEKIKRDNLEKNIEESRLKVMDEMEIAKTEHQAILMRQELARRQEELQRLEDQRREFEMRRNERDERRRQEENLYRQHEDALRRRQQVQQDDMRLQQDMMRRQQEEMMQMEGSRRPMPGVGGPQPLMAGGSGVGGPQSGTDMLPQQVQGGAGRQSRFDQQPGSGFNNNQNRGPNQGGQGGNNGTPTPNRGGPGAPGVLGSAPGSTPGGNQQGGRGAQQGGRGQAQGGRGPAQGGPGANMAQGGGPGSYGSGRGGPNRSQMDDGRGRMAVERRDDRGGDRGRNMERRDDYMAKRMRRF